MHLYKIRVRNKNVFLVMIFISYTFVKNVPILVNKNVVKQLRQSEFGSTFGNVFNNFFYAFELCNTVNLSCSIGRIFFKIWYKKKQTWK